MSGQISEGLGSRWNGRASSWDPRGGKEPGKGLGKGLPPEVAAPDYPPPPAALGCCFIFLGPPPPPRMHRASSWASSRVVMGMPYSLHSGLRKGCPRGGGRWQRLFRHPLHHFLIEIGLAEASWGWVGGFQMSPGCAVRRQSDPQAWSGSLRPLQAPLRHGVLAGS